MVRRNAKEIAVFISVIAVTVFLHLLSSNIPDPDSFYHIRHAWLYRTTSLTSTAFPWTYFSVIQTFASDIWYGFHLFLLPFSYLDLILGIRIAGVVLTVLLLLGFYWLGKRHRWELAEFWPFFLLLAVPNTLFNFLAVRPHTLSLFFSLMLLSFAAVGSWQSVFWASFGITFFHLGLFWIVPVIVFITCGVQLLEKLIYKDTKVRWHNILSAFGGMAIGWALRPRPIAAAKLAYVQIVKLLFEKTGDLPLTFGKELSPIGGTELISTSALFLIFWTAAFVFTVWVIINYPRRLKEMPSPERILFLSSGLISLLFWGMALFLARRSMVQWVAFGTVFIAMAYTYILPKDFKKYGLGFFVVVLMAMFPYAVYRHNLNMKYVAFEPKEFIEVSEWLKENSNPGDIVFNVHWDNFPSLFLWNQKNYYVGGMDPIFQYEYSPDLYWKFYYLSQDLMTDKTCGSFPCLRSDLEETYGVLVKDFNAKYIVAEEWRNPKLFRYLEGDPRFEKAFTGPYESVFGIKR